jgi:Alpha-galactosidase
MPMSSPSTAGELVHLRAAGVSVLVDVRDGLLPAIVHWGADLGDLSPDDARALADANVPPLVNNVVDEPVRVALVPEQRTGWAGRPGLSGSRAGRDWSPAFTVTELRTEAGQAGGSLRVLASDPDAALTLAIELELTASGLLRTRATVTNDADEPYQLDELVLALPLPPRAREILDFAGRWSKERTPQRRELTVGTHLREGRRGRTGPDAATVLSVGAPGFGFAEGEVWGVHVGFSGNHRHYAERMASGEQVLGGGELLLPGEVRLGRGQSYRTPWLYGSYGAGLDEQARRFHDHLRARPQHPHTPRPVTLNVWEAVYFDHDLGRLTALADRAAELGVERYVLDDGWFRHRRDDTAGLGDWYVDETVWPDGLTPLIEHVHGLGMQFGLWFEPEMVNPDSDLARAHPEWIMQTGGRMPVSSRHQQVLNLGIPAAYDYVLERMTAILTDNEIDYIKWDHNRDLVDAGTTPGGEPGVHAQTLAVYGLIDELKRRFPGLEIESCSSGGARVDLGILERTDRVWVSDCIDPLERQQMNRWTMQLLPPELMGSHVASGRSHTTGRVHELSFRAGTALFGHFGIEWDLNTASDADRAQLREWIELYKARRDLLHGGTLVRMDESDETLWITGIVAADRSNALFSLAYLGRSEVSPLGRFTLRGLDPDRRYRVRPLPIGDPSRGYRVPDWFGTEWQGTVLSGRALAAAGLQAPASYPERVWLLDVSEA